MDGRDNRGRFALGASGNPRGRPKQAEGFAGLVREKTRDGEALIDAAIDLLGSGDERVRLEALRFLADRAYGKPLQPSSIEVDASIGVSREDLARLSDGEIEQLYRIQARLDGVELLDPPWPPVAAPALPAPEPERVDAEPLPEVQPVPAQTEDVAPVEPQPTPEAQPAIATAEPDAEPEYGQVYTPKRRAPGLAIGRALPQDEIEL